MKYILALFLLLFSFGAASATESGALYYVPPGQLTVSVQAMNLGLSNIIGLFSNATGSFVFDDQAKSVSNLRIAVDTTSIVSNTSANQASLASLLDAAQYPEIRFTALDAVVFTDGKASVKGTMTCGGVSKPVTMDAVLNGTGANPGIASKGKMLGLSLHGSFKRADFGIPDDASVPGRFGDTITLQLEMQATKQ